ncbi:flagellar hook-associated protein FlgK [Sedimentibacter sp. zth1]|uniref:flagellar hook-associated protein FlgK n=1 Tax=Sedimentibacter sp. zth1 TaxID=2816908 RepID=UPI001A911F06|nr:flagellar hook-associated protein FlgK [Sedimentibacter sp. zth1]QSX06025.1 flagellar hook-associated protein FlgK [Sedimentibacter sp. zth1]
MLRSTFSGFQVANRGLSSSQRLLDITAQNITNINTEGYTRQRLDLYSIAYSSGSSQFSALYGGIGRGVGDSGASQIRDPFLDIRYRSEAAKVGEQDIMKDALKDLTAIFDEVTTDGLDAQFSDLIKQLHALSATPSDPVIEGVVKTSATMVSQLLNHYSSQIETVKDQQISYLEKDSMSKVNNLLSAIGELNDQIKQQNVHGDKALELNDKRNSLIDELSTYMNIDLIREKENIGNDQDVEVLTIVSNDITDAAGNKLQLVNQSKAAKLNVDSTDKNNIVVSIETSIDANFSDGDDITSSLKKGELAGYLNFLNNKAEFTDGAYSTENRGIQFYEGMLDGVAREFTKMFNDANEYPAGTKKDLFEADGGGEITAANIKISDAWKNANDCYITNTKQPAAGDDNKGANDNILTMIALFDKKISFNSKIDGTGNFVFSGTIQEGFSHAASTLDLQINHAQDLYKSYGETLITIDTSRASISGVSMDEEGINLLHYNKSYSAAARLMTTLDDALSTLINNTGRVGL